MSRVTANAMREEMPGGAPPTRAPMAFHTRLPEYARTPLVDAPGVARWLGVERVWVKDESARIGLPSFKILGASWAVYRALDRLVGGLPEWSTIADLATALTPYRPLALAAATDGNHGRAVARMAKLLRLDGRIFVPAGTAAARIEAIEGEGASCEVVDGTYDDVVARSAEEAAANCLVISDTSWPGYEDVPRWVIDGYSTIFFEIDDELGERGDPGPDLVMIPLGVGALGAAAARHYRGPGAERAPFLAGAEPEAAACVLASVEAGEIVTVPGPHTSIMAGLNCGTPSRVAWPFVSAGFDTFVAMSDDRAREAMRVLAGEGIEAGETGAAGLGGARELLESGGGVLEGASFDRVLLLCTEGATDPRAYAQIVGGSTPNAY
ncbi:MAG: diaminopropionate ammonia-lyase [Actinomycetota bacterium]